MQKFQQAHPLWTHQQISNSAESWNWVQKVEVEWQQILTTLTDEKVAKAHYNQVADRLGVYNNIKMSFLK